jgi:hypothetical protein
LNYPVGDGTNTPNMAGQPADTDILRARAIVINTPRSLSVSEPVEGYDLLHRLIRILRRVERSKGMLPLIP